MTDFIQGDEARLSNAVTDLTGAAVDPGTVSLTVELPDGTKFYPDVTRSGVGLYHSDIPLAVPGQYLYRWSSTSPHMSAAEGELLVGKSAL